MVLGLARALQGMPNFEQPAQVNVAGTDVIGPTMAAYQAQVQQWQADQARSNALMGGLFGLAGTALGTFFGGPMGGMIGGSIGSRIGGG